MKKPSPKKKNYKVKDNYFDLAVASLNFTQIKTVLNQLKERVKHKRILILSGLLNSEEEKIKIFYKATNSTS